jgi:hypothetical protein
MLNYSHHCFLSLQAAPKQQAQQQRQQMPSALVQAASMLPPSPPHPCSGRLHPQQEEQHDLLQRLCAEAPPNRQHPQSMRVCSDIPDPQQEAQHKQPPQRLSAEVPRNKQCPQPLRMFSDIPDPQQEAQHEQPLQPLSAEAPPTHAAPAAAAQPGAPAAPHYAFHAVRYHWASGSFHLVAIQRRDCDPCSVCLQGVCHYVILITLAAPA